MDHLTKWIGAFTEKPKRVFVVHGDDKVTEFFADHINQKLGLDAVAPYSGDTYDLLTGACIKQGDRKLVEKKKKDAKASNTVFARLVAAGERLVAIIRRSEGLPNKELARFADQINELCNKMER